MKRWLLAVLFVSIAAAGCGGGGSSSPVPAPIQKSGNANAQILITIPKASPAASQRKIVSPNTATIVLSVVAVNGAPPVAPTPPPLTVSITDPTYCTTNAGSTSCRITYLVPIATSVTIQVATFDANGNELNVGTLTIDTTIPNATPAPLTLGDYPSSITFAKSSISFANTGSSTPVTQKAVLTVYNGTTPLTGAVTYGGAITVTPTNAPTGAITVTPSSFSQPDGTSGASNTIAISYDSSKGALGSTAALVFSFNGTTLATLPLATLNYTPSSITNLVVGGSTGTVTVNEPNYSGAFTVTGNSSYISTQCSPANCTPATAGGNVVISILPDAATTTTNLTIADASGTTATVPLTITSTTGTGPVVGAPTIEMFAAPDTTGTLYGIALGPDKQTLYFTDRAGQEIGAIPSPSSCTTTCTIDESGTGTIPAASNLASIIATGSGTLLVGDEHAGTDPGNLFNVSCTLTTTLTCSESALSLLPTIPAIEDMALAPDGNIYAAVNYNDAQTNLVRALSIPSNACCTIGSGFSVPMTATLPTTGIFGIAPDAESHGVWFTNTYSGLVGFFNPTCACGTQLPTGPGFGGLARPRGSSAIAAVHPSGASGPGTPFAPPLNGIVEAPDGNVYVAEAGANRIDRLNATTWQGVQTGGLPVTCTGASCVYTPLTMPNPSAVPMHLITAPDGNVWFTDTTGYIGVIRLSTCATACQVSEYKVGGSPWGITVGPDGNVWFTDSSSNKIGKVVIQ